MKQYTTIGISFETKKKLSSLGNTGNSYEDIILKLIELHTTPSKKLDEISADPLDPKKIEDLTFEVIKNQNTTRQS